MIAFPWYLGVLAACCGSFPTGVAAQEPAIPDLPRAVYDDYRTGAGHFEDGAWRLRLTAREVAWRPRGEDGPELTVYAFASGDGLPQVTAP